MVAFVGADTGELRSLADEFSRRSGELSNDVVSTISGRLAGNPWDGPDRGQFDHLWNQQLVHQIRKVATALDDAAKTLRRNADDQAKTSGGDGSTSSHGSRPSGRIPAPDGGRGLGPKTKINREGFTEPRGGKYGRDRDYLDLADAAYDHTVGPQHDARIPGGWEEVSSDELRKLGIDPDLLGMKGEQFSATLYRDVDGNYVLAFEGTDPNDARDLMTDVHGTHGVPGQVKRAVDLAGQVKSQLEQNGIDGDSLVFTGHSLGGELASAASISTGNEAVTFNAAGLSDQSYDYASDYRRSATGEASSRHEAESRVKAYSTSDDWLTTLQASSNAPDAFGKQQVLPTKGNVSGSTIDAHNTGVLRSSLDSQALRAGEYYH